MDKLSFLNKTLGILDNQDVNVNQLILEAHQLGIRVNVYANQTSRAFMYADVVTKGALTDKDKLKQFANQCQWVLYVNGVGINGALVNYLKQFTSVPQGMDELDLVNDQSIFHVFLKSRQVNALPYLTVFSMDDVKQALTKIQLPVIIRPVQTDVTKSREFTITDKSQLGQITSLFNGEAYLMESLPEDARYFNLTLFKTSGGNQIDLPIVENHYQGSKFDFANLNPELLPQITDKFKLLAQKVTNQLNYVGGLTVSLILTKDHQIYIESLSLPFDLENNIFNQTSDSINKMSLRVVIGLEPEAVHLHKTWALKSLNHSNADQAQRLWINNSPIMVNLGSLINPSGHQGYALLSADSLDNVEKKMKASQL